MVRNCTAVRTDLHTRQPAAPGDKNKEEPDRRGEEQKPSTTIIQGAQSPLLGDKGGSQSHSSDDTGAQQPSLALVGVPEESGRGSRKQEDQKRTKLYLEKWAQVQGKKAKGSTRKLRPRKRQGTEDNPKAGRFKDIRTMFEEMSSAQAKGSRGKEKKEPDNEEEN